MADRLESVHLAQFPDAADVLGSASVRRMIRTDEDWTTLLAVRDEVLKALEEARNTKQIGKSLEAQVDHGADPAYSVLKRYARAIFVICSSCRR